ncbi:MAG TPA: ATP-binding protein [Candidatus Acidoferrum sp.]|nr:ATP-binding protein [Candidatus Acidoferrum sp.]
MDIPVSLVDGPVANAPSLDADGKHDVLAHIVDAITNPLFVKDEQHRLVVVNDAFCTLLGRTRANIVGRTDFDFVPAEEARIYQAKDKVVLETGAADVNEEPLTNAAGKQHWIVTRKSLITTPDGKRYVNGVITDITERKHMEIELREANANLKSAMDKLANSERLATIGQVAATVSHELRNPLGAIRNSMALVHQRTAGKQLGVERALERVDRNIQRCAAIIGALLEFTHKKDLVRSPTAVDGWLGLVLTHYKLPDGIALARELNAAGEVAIDTEQFRQVVAHLVDNAAQALTDPAWNPPSGHHRRITVRSESAGPHLRLSVVDTGPGIPADVLPRIFEPLFTTKNFGVGLGLPTVRQIVELHGGTIDVDSAVDVGTTVTIWLPRLADAASAPAPASGREAAA